MISHWIEFDNMSMKQTNVLCSNEVSVSNRGLIGSNFDYLLLLCVYRYRWNYCYTNEFMSSYWVEFDHMSMKQTTMVCSIEVFVMNGGLIGSNFKNLLLLNVY